MSNLSIIYFLLNYYDKVYIYIGKYKVTHWTPKLDNYLKAFFSACNFYNKRIFIINTYNLLNNSNYDDFHVCNTTSCLKESVNFLKEFINVKINPKHYFNHLNQLYNILDIPEKYKSNDKIILPNKKLKINHIFTYELIGLNNNVRMNYFNFQRNISKEIKIKKEILKKFNIKENEKYNITNNSNDSKLVIEHNPSVFAKPINLKDYIKNDYKCIEISYLSDFPGYLLKLIEDAEEIHLIEGSNVNFLYHCQFKDIMKKKPIFFHVWCRNRHWPYEGCLFDYAWKMMANPKLENWKFIFSKKEL